MKLIDPISAIIPWYCYDYQGNIALYVSLEKMHELLKAGKDIDSWKLQIEGEEDFSLIKDDKYVSLHQVKAGKVKLDSQDKFCFMTELVENDGAYGYLHITSKGSHPRGFYKCVIEHSDELIKKLKQDVVEKKDLNGESEDEKIIFEFIKNNSKKGDCYCILQYVLEKAYGHKYTIKNVKDIIPEIISTIEANKAYFTQKVEDAKSKDPSAKEDKIFIDVYPEIYEANKKIREDAAEWIKKILELQTEDYDYADSDYCQNVYMRLFDHMKEVMYSHVDDNRLKDKCIITFEEILKVITVDYPKEYMTEKYLYYQVIRSISDNYADYPEKIWTKCKADSCHECSDKEDCNLRKQVKVLMDKKVEMREKVAENLILGRPEKGKINNLPSDNMVSDHLLDILHDVKTMELSDKNVFRATNDSKDIYQVTLDDSYHKEQLLTRIDDFRKDPANIEMLYEIKVLITDRINNEEIVLEDCNITNITQGDMEGMSGTILPSDAVEKLNDDVTRTNVIRLVNKDTAIGELK